jgi:hypothetical protein
VKIFVDSGAFGAWQQGETIRLIDYVAFLKRNASVIGSYAALDVIPGHSGDMDWSAEAVELSARQSYENLQIMKDAGLSPIPVFHMGERFHWLRRMLDDGEGYIGISPFLKAGRADIISWLDDCFALLKADPTVKTHGFGVTAHLVLARYPWTSVDSGTWWRQAVSGKIAVPIKGTAGYDYDVAPDVIPVSHDLLHIPGHVDTLDDIGLHFITEYLRVVGVDLAETRYSERTRLRVWALYHQALANWHGIDIVFGTNPRTTVQQIVLTECGVTSRLLSFYDMKDSADALDKYMAAAASPPAAPRPGSRNGSWRDLWRNRSYVEHRKLALYSRLISSELSKQTEVTGLSRYV